MADRKIFGDRRASGLSSHRTGTGENDTNNSGVIFLMIVYSL